MPTRRDFLKITGASALATLLHPLSVLTAAPERPRPNILWISTEDISPQLGCYGDRHAHTPRLDRLAERGVVYDNAFTVAGVCAPNRSSIITGMYAASLGTQHMRSGGEGTEHSIQPVVPAPVNCFSASLREAGYYCTNNYKQDYNFVPSDAAWDESSHQAHWRNRPDSNQPFFAVFNYTGTHEGSVHLDDAGHAELTKRLTPDQRQDPAQLTLPPYYPDTPAFRRLWANYYEVITGMDYWAGDLLDQLAADGLAEDTIVFFWSDHGVGLPRAKRWLYDSGTKIPLLVSLPKKFRTGDQGQPGTREDRLVSSVDFAATVLNLTGLPIPEHVQGQPFLGPDRPPARDYIYGHRDRMDERYDIIRMVRDQRYQYIRNYEPFKPYHQYMNTPEGGADMRDLHRLAAQGQLPPDAWWFTARTKPVEELYDTRTDPHTVHNLAGDSNYQSILERLRGAHEQWMLDIMDMGLIPEPELVTIEHRYGSRYAFFRQVARDNRAWLRALRAAASLAGTPSPADLPGLRQVLQHAEASFRYWGMLGLGNLGPDADSAYDRVYEGLQDQAPVVRVAAARALFRMERPGEDALPVLIAELQSPHEWVRLQAATVLDEIGEPARPAIPALQAALDDTYNKYVVRVANHALNQLLGTNHSVR